MQTPYKFFMSHAGYSYDPATETKEQGKRRCAKQLAKAEKQALEAMADYDWRIDSDVDSSSFSDEKPAWKLWSCFLLVGDKIVESLHAIDFGRNKTPWHDPYKRVVQAELALEYFASRKEKQC